MTHNFDEIQLIEQCKEGKRMAQKAIYERYAPSMLAICVRYVSDNETAKDILQDGFVKAFTSIRSFSGTESFGGWLRRIFVTTSLEYLRRNKKWKGCESIDFHLDTVQAENNDVVAKISADELLKCVAELPGRYRVIFNLFAIEGYTHSEISEMLHINENSSRSEYSRARKMLQKRIEDIFK